ncbi:MAG: DNA mismatch repair protein MutS, partial [Lachnospiraceae bacterium]|nr:DNA mismatch repair protein MutS [Lachnospiraceae bacterium]
KTSFLRAAAVAQIMAQAGMFVPAKGMKTGIFRGIFTHFGRNEDVTLNSGRLEEELSRLSRMIDVMKPGSLLFLNESFATTSENEGAAIADDIIRALTDNKITVFFVTHIYAYAKRAYRENYENTQFLQTERNERNERTYRIISGEPSETGYGMEMYSRIICGTE